MKLQLTAHGIGRLLIIQFAVMTGLAILALAFGEMVAASSVMAGALAYIIPNAFFARKVFKHQGAGSAKKIVRAFYKGEGIKIVLTIGLFAMIFKFMNIRPLILFVTYISMQMLGWLAPLFVSGRLKQSK